MARRAKMLSEDSSSDEEMDTFKYIWAIPLGHFHGFSRHVEDSKEFYGGIKKLSWYLQLDFQVRPSNMVHIRLFLNNYKNTAVHAKFKLSILKNNKDYIILYESKEAQLFQPCISPNVITWDYRTSVYYSQNFSNRVNLFCEIKVVDIVKNHGLRSLVKMPECCLLKDLENIFEEQKFCDITFLVGGQEIQAHKNILSGRSRVFAAMFENEFAESKQNCCVTITDIDHKVFKEILRFMYTGQAKKKESMAEELLIGADKYDLERLKVICEEVLIHKISSENVTDLLAFAERHNANQLKVQILAYIKNNFANVKKTVSGKDSSCVRNMRSTNHSDNA